MEICAKSMLNGYPLSSVTYVLLPMYFNTAPKSVIFVEKTKQREHILLTSRLRQIRLYVSFGMGIIMAPKPERIGDMDEETICLVPRNEDSKLQTGPLSLGIGAVYM